MKYVLLLILIFTGLVVFSQSRKEIDVLARNRLLQKTVFGTKDSITLEDLFAKTATYGHSNGKIETREEAIRNISNNKSSYTDTSLKNYNIIFNDDVAIVRYVMRETETNIDGKATPLNLSIMLVWVEEKGKWKLFGRQAVRLL
jgi:ketosteroid isomerase-like protein